MVTIFLILLTTLPTTTITDCVNSCCVNCKDTCAVCYRLTRLDKAACPCVEEILPMHTMVGLQERQERLAEIRERKAVERIVGSESILAKKNNVRLSEESVSIPVCIPSCCPSTSCTVFTCPLCYKQFRNNPGLCPCVNTGNNTLVFCQHNLNSPLTTVGFDIYIS